MVLLILLITLLWVFFQGVFVHLTCECLKVLRSRGLYSVIEIEKCFSSSPQGSLSVAEPLYQSVCKVLERSSSLTVSDKIRLISLYMHQMGVSSDQSETVQNLIKLARLK
jgi:hypothetical protein